jgi:hypothetical protein
MMHVRGRGWGRRSPRRVTGVTGLRASLAVVPVMVVLAMAVAFPAAAVAGDSVVPPSTTTPTVDPGVTDPPVTTTDPPPPATTTDPPVTTEPADPANPAPVTTAPTDPAPAVTVVPEAPTVQVAPVITVTPSTNLVNLQSVTHRGNRLHAEHDGRLGPM